MLSQPPGDATCDTCLKPIRPEAPVWFERGEIFHLACRSRSTVLRSMELRERTAENLAQAAQILEHSPHLRCSVYAKPIRNTAALRQDDADVHLGCAAESVADTTRTPGEPSPPRPSDRIA